MLSYGNPRVFIMLAPSVRPKILNRAALPEYYSSQVLALFV